MLIKIFPFFARVRGEVETPAGVGAGGTCLAFLPMETTGEDESGWLGWRFLPSENRN